jgi:hypothetical protein
MTKVTAFFGSEFNVCRSQILFQTLHLGGARNGNDPRFLREYPGERNLGHGRSFPLSKFIEQIDKNPVRFHRLCGEARQGGAVVVTAVELRLFVQSAGEVTSAERAVRNKTDAEFFKCRQDLLFRLPSHQGIFALNSGKRLNGMGPADRLCAHFAKTEMLHLALLN